MGTVNGVQSVQHGTVDTVGSMGMVGEVNTVHVVDSAEEAHQYRSYTAKEQYVWITSLNPQVKRLLLLKTGFEIITTIVRDVCLSHWDCRSFTYYILITKKPLLPESEPPLT